MAEDKTNSVSVRIPIWVMDEIEKRLNAMPRPSRPTRGEMLVEAWVHYPVLTTPQSSELGTAQSPKRITDNPDESVENSTDLRGSTDSKFRQCVDALREIWAADDSEIKLSITSVCRCFARMARLATEARGHGDEDAADLKQRAERFLETALNHQSGDRVDKKEDGQPAASASGLPRVGSRTVRKTRGGKK